VIIAFLLILNTGATPDAWKEWQSRTPVNQTWADFRRELQEHNENSASSQELPAAEAITLSMVQSTMSTTYFLLMEDL
jgi:hypothetical protein